MTTADTYLGPYDSKEGDTAATVAVLANTQSPSSMQEEHADGKETARKAGVAPKAVEQQTSPPYVIKRRDVGFVRPAIVCAIATIGLFVFYACITNPTSNIGTVTLLLMIASLLGTTVFGLMAAGSVGESDEAI